MPTLAMLLIGRSENNRGFLISVKMRKLARHKTVKEAYFRCSIFVNVKIFFFLNSSQHPLKLTRLYGKFIAILASGFLIALSVYTCLYIKYQPKWHHNLSTDCKLAITVNCEIFSGITSSLTFLSVFDCAG